MIVLFVGRDRGRRLHPLEPALLPARLGPGRSGTDFYEVEAELPTAQAVVPGQGQTVNVAGVKVGEVGEVKLENGRAVVTMQIQDEYKPIYKDATILLRPKTGLKDMILALDPGTEAAGEMDEGGRVTVGNTLPDVNPDEVLAVARRRHARLPADPAQRRRHRLPRRLDRATSRPRSAGPARDVQALRADRARRATNSRKPARAAAHATSAARSTTSSSSPRRSARRTSSSPRSWTPRTRTSRRSPQEEDSLREALSCSRARSRRRPPRSTDTNALAKELGPDARGAAAVRARAGPVAAPPAPVPARHHADHPRPGPAVRARRPAHRA